MSSGMVPEDEPEEIPMRKLRIFLVVRIKVPGIQIEWPLTLNR